jgi:peptide/nickel transport system substrate-binding protein
VARRASTIFALAAAVALVAHAPAAAQTQAQEPLRIAIPGADGSLTPYTFESGYALMSLVYDSLMWRDAAGKAQPWLARSVNRDPTGRSVQVRLRPGVKWHDGQPLTAADVAFTFAYMSRHPHPRFTPELQDIESVHVVNELTVSFTLRRRSLGFSDQPLADVPILPQHLWQGLPRGRLAPAGLPVGTGPYRLTRYEPGRSYRFEANRGYFRGVPSVARIDVAVIRREDEIANELRRRRVDAVPLTVPPGTTPPRVAGVRFSDDISYSGTMLLFNVARAPFDRLAARRAVSQSLDLDAIAANATDVAGGVVAADQGMLHPQSRWTRAGDLHAFDANAARLAFIEQGVGPFEIAAPRNDPVRLATAKRVVRALTNVGARATLLELSPGALDRALGRVRQRASFDAAVVGIPALASYDPAYLRAIFGDPRSAPLNDGRYRSTAFDALAGRVASASTDRERKSVVNEQLQLLARELPAVPLLFGGGTFAYRPAAYDRWVGIRGTGILDKRSFLRGEVAAVNDAPGGGAPADLLDPSDDEGISLVPVIVVFVVVLFAGCALWLRRRRA